MATTGILAPYRQHEYIFPIKYTGGSIVSLSSSICSCLTLICTAIPPATGIQEGIGRMLLLRCYVEVLRKIINHLGGLCAAAKFLLLFEIKRRHEVYELMVGVQSK